MSLGVHKFNTKQNVFERTSRLHKTEIEVANKKRTLMQLRYKREKQVSKQDKVKAFAGATIGTLIPMLIFSKLQKKSFLKTKEENLCR